MLDGNVLLRQKRDEVPKGTLSCPDRIMEVFYQLRHYEGSHLLRAVCGRKLIQQTPIKADFVVKMYEIHKVVSANEGLLNDKKFVTITDALSGKETKIVLKESEDYGPTVEMVALDNKKVMAKIHWGGSGPFYDGFTVDVENEKYVGHEELE